MISLRHLSAAPKKWKRSKEKRNRNWRQTGWEDKLTNIKQERLSRDNLKRVLIQRPFKNLDPLHNQP